jgi:catechol 2,3-dioxygenase-like lactoylglutathione lyase family enzyme
MPPQINGSVHVVLVVKDAKHSAEWYSKVFGFSVVREEVEAVLDHDAAGATKFTSSILFHVPTRLFLGLAEAREPLAEQFDWRRPGLQHLAFHVPERSDLARWSEHLDSLGIQHSPELSEGPGLLVRFHDLDGIPVEIFWADTQLCERLFVSVARGRARASQERRRLKPGP